MTLTRPVRSSSLGTSALGAFSFGTMLAACTATVIARSNAMPEFAFLYRVTRQVSPDEAARRAAAVQQWAIALSKREVIRQAFLFADTGVSIDPDGGVTPIASDGAVGGVTIVRANDMGAATALARTFPGIPFGTAVEVRAVEALPAPPPVP
jgi:hypothetical protein